MQIPPVGIHFIINSALLKEQLLWYDFWGKIRIFHCVRVVFRNFVINQKVL